MAALNSLAPDQALDQRSERLLDERAKRLAERVNAADVARADEAETVLTFGLGGDAAGESAGERFGLSLRAVSAVVPLTKLTTVPTADGRVAGIMAIKGEVHTVFDLARVLDLPDTYAAKKAGYVMVLRLRGVHFGFGVDRIDAIDRLDASASNAPAPTPGRRYVTTESGGTLLLIDNLNHLLAAFLEGEHS